MEKEELLQYVGFQCCERSLQRGVKAEAKKSVPAVTVDAGASKMMRQLLKQQSEPDIDIDVFSGNPMDFHYFMVVFNEMWRRK